MNKVLSFKYAYRTDIFGPRSLITDIRSFTEVSQKPVSELQYIGPKCRPLNFKLDYTCRSEATWLHITAPESQDIFCNPILFAICTSAISKLCDDVYSGMWKSAQ
jgi:hypothetical protein